MLRVELGCFTSLSSPLKNCSWFKSSKPMTLFQTLTSCLSLFKLLIDRIDHCSFESIQALINFCPTFHLVNFAGENVSVLTACFKVVVRHLPSASIPPNVIEYFLNGMSACSSDDFKEDCTSYLGFVSSHIYTDWSKGRNLLSQLDCYASTPDANYATLSNLQKRDGFLHKASIFWLDPCRSPHSCQHQCPSYCECFLHQTCATCGKNHPTWAHGKPDALDKKEHHHQQQQDTPWPSPLPSANPKFNAIYQAILDCLDSDLLEGNLYAHLFGSDDCSSGLPDDSHRSSLGTLLPSASDCSVEILMMTYVFWHLLFNVWAAFF